jgi:hypothetical protein
MPLLRSLRLCIYTASGDGPFDPVQLQPLDLSPCTINHLDTEIIDESMYYFAAYQENVAILLDNLRLMTPNLQTLRLYSTSEGYMRHFVRYASSFESLESVIISHRLNPFTTYLPTIGCPLASGEDYIIKTNKLEVVNYEIPSSVKTTGVKYLRVETPYMRTNVFPRLRDSMINDHMCTPMSTPSEWANLHTIVLSMPRQEAIDPLNWEAIGFSLPRVTKIRLVQVGTPLPCLAFAALCQEIATRPHSFPSLECISGGLPEWDILFIMLERRNFLPLSVQPPSSLPHLSAWPALRDVEYHGKGGRTNERISRIKRLELDYLPGIRILKPLTELLGGKFTVRPSNYEVSLTSIAEEYLDLTRYVLISGL